MWVSRLDTWCLSSHSLKNGGVMNIRYNGSLFVNTDNYPMTPAHWNYLQGWLTCFASLRPDLRNHACTVTPEGPTTLLIELPGTDISHFETLIQPTQVIVYPGNIAPSMEQDKPKSREEILKDWSKGDA